MRGVSKRTDVSTRTPTYAAKSKLIVVENPSVAASLDPSKAAPKASTSVSDCAIRANKH